MHRSRSIFSQRVKNIQSTLMNGHRYTTQFSIQDIPRPITMSFIGTKLQFLATGSGTKLHEFIDRRHKELGPIFCEKLDGNSELVFISDPDLIRTVFMNLEGKYPSHILPDSWMLYESLYGSKRGLFFMNGNEWLENRRIMNKYFLKENSENWLETPVKETITRFTQQWKRKAETGNIVPDLESEFYRLSIDIIIAIMMGNNSSLRLDNQYESLLEIFSNSVKKIFHATTKLSGLPIQMCQKLDMKVWRDFKECVDTSLLMAHKIVDEMIENRQYTNGLIKMLAEENISHENIKKIVADFIIAAGDTTAYTSLWTILLLSKNKFVMEEIRSQEYSFLKYVVKESMRLYPVAPFLTRILPKESTLGQYVLDAGTPIIASIYTSGRDDQNFSKPNEFLPYRWDRNDPRRKDLKNHVSSASLPFALGSRSCIGKKLAILQISELIKQMVDNFEFELLNKDEVLAVTTQILVPSKDVKISFSLQTNKDT